MTGARWEQVRAVLEDALDRAPAERQEFIESACAGDEGLRSEVEEYLRCEDLANRALPVSEWLRAEPPGDAAPLVDPERIGVYRIVRRIGEGGMGVVYLAERDDGEYRQQVAVKVLKPGPRSDRMHKRFRRERQLLARLHHPHIAQLMDGGTAGGQMYYVMEYVDGLPITSYCRERKLNVRQRLELFGSVCAAVSHAHRKLVIHCDLKPGNVLVTHDGVPRLLDFGLARLFQDPAGEDLSVSTMPLLTPAYASPEQVAGDHLGTATDVYSLGVLLYELLTGRNPHVRGEQSPIEIYHAISQADPDPPSQSAGPSLRSELAGDLDDIVLMALRKEPERRYGSVEDLRQDIERYLRGFPVHASRGATAYRCRKYLGRNRLGLALAGLAAAGALAATSLIWWEGRQAQMRFNDVRGLAHAVIFDLHDAIQDLPGSTAARQLLVARALEYLKKLEAGGGARDIDLQMELVEAYIKIGNVQGHPRHANLGDTAAAEASYAQARRIAVSVLARHPDLERAQDALAAADAGLGGMRWLRGDARARFELGRERSAILLKKAERHPQSPDLLAEAHFSVAQDLLMAQDWKAAAPAWQRAVESAERAVRAVPSEPSAQYALYQGHFQLAAVYIQLDDPGKALVELSAAGRIASELLASNPRDPLFRRALCDSLQAAAAAENQTGDWRSALAGYRRALAMRRDSASADRKDIAAQLEMATVLYQIAPLEEEAGNRERAIQFAAEAAQTFGAAVQVNPQQREALWEWRDALRESCEVRAHRAADPSSPAAQAVADWKSAARACEGALDAAARLPRDGAMPDNNDAVRTDILKQLAECRRHIGQAAH